METLNLPNIYISQGFGGRLTEIGLLRTEGTVETSVRRTAFDHDICLFKVAAEGFLFAFGIRDRCVYFQRNENVLRIPYAQAAESLSDNNMLVASWGAHGMVVMIGGLGPEGHPVGAEHNLPVSPPPSSLVKWARMRSLVPSTIFDSELQFLSRVHSSLESLAHKFLEMHTPNVFWDVNYDGQKIVSRTPKRETDLHPFVTAALSDQMLLSSIDVTPELTLRGGRLDFLFTGAIRNRGIGHCMVEFKNAHSSDLIHGIEHQLPEYMRAKSIDHGAYCVFDFRGEWFDFPKASPAAIQTELIMALKRAQLPSEHAIKFYFYTLGKGIAPSII